MNMGYLEHSMPGAKRSMRNIKRRLLALGMAISAPSRVPRVKKTIGERDSPGKPGLV
jgi:hypothetical protein